MSMMINANSYINGTIQNTRMADGEKHGRKDAAAEAGKIRQSSRSASLDQVNMGEDGVAVAQVSRQQGAEPAAPQKKPASPRMDTVEISEEGQAAGRKMQSRSTAAEEGGKASGSGYKYKPKDLSGYTDAELKQMYYRGEITRQEYEEETGKRRKE